MGTITVSVHEQNGTCLIKDLVLVKGVDPIRVPMTQNNIGLWLFALDSGKVCLDVSVPHCFDTKKIVVTVDGVKYVEEVQGGNVNYFMFPPDGIIGYATEDEGVPDVEDGDQSDFEARVRELLSDIRDRIEQFLEEDR
jgi:hypothetical protein